jgi:amino-acid N-acetyltransferase
MDELIVRPAVTQDVRSIRELVDTYASDRRLLSKATVTLFEDVQEFVVAESDARIVGCGALHVMWEDLAEVRTIAVLPDLRRRGIGSKVLAALIDRGRELGVERFFGLTFETEFFASHGFQLVEKSPIEPEVYSQLLQSQDDGVAEFLDLERVKPNTLGNTRMLLQL